ncbi:MAG: SIS domain-containing protein [Bryobacteraceae bacterium]
MSVPLLDNILAQPQALQAVASRQFTEGRPALIASAALLRSAKRIVLTGMGGSFAACIPLSYFFAARGVQAQVIETSELLHFQTPALDAQTAVILVSRSGESVEAVKLLSLLKQRGCPVVGVVNVPESTIASHATETIVLGSPPDELVAIQTYTATVATLLLLGAEYFNELDRATSDLNTTIDGLSRGLPHLNQDWTDFLAHASCLYLLGRGPSLASVNAGALLFHEVAKLPAIGMSSAQFRHGPVEVVSEQFRAIVFGSEELDAALERDLIAIHGSVRRIGPPWPADVPRQFAPIFEIVPLQFAAYRLAQSRSIPLGRFRFAPAITLSEQGFSRP